MEGVPEQLIGQRAACGHIPRIAFLMSFCLVTEFETAVGTYHASRTPGGVF